jgi:uncharacterized protein with von Willebrand factor type A (vWA) domain
VNTTARDAPWHRLDALPKALWLPGIVNSVGDSGRRLADLARWRDALDAGTLPAADAHFGDPAALGALRAVVGELGLPALARGAPGFAEQLLRTLLWHLDRLIDRPLHEPRSDAIARIAAEFRAEWQQEKADWESLLALLPGLGELARLRWDALKGLLRRREWRDAERLAALMARRPELAALIARIGRAERALPAAPPAAAPPETGAQPRRLGLRALQTHLPDAPGELRGIRLAGHLERMLGSEAQQIRHPVLHKLWRAKRAEARLLTYDSQAVLIDWRCDPHAPPREATAPPPPAPRARGPMLIALDTSGSMQGAPEQIAKAVVLQALRVAQRERRGCRVIAFGGPDELIERDLGFTPEGLAALFELIGQGFDGGTDLQAPIERAVAAVHDAQWASADLLVVSDGEFGCTPATLQRLDDARERLGLRVQGVLIGDRETMGLMEVCDHIHWLKDWRRDGPAGTTFSPVHSRSLTALFFPQALSERAARHRPPS